MKSLKLKLFEFRKELTIEQDEISNIVSEHFNLCDNYSEKEIYNSLTSTLETHKYYDNVKSLLESIDEELSINPLLYTLKDLYAKIARKENRFLYENALTSILECINQLTDEDRKIAIVNELKIYEWIPEIKFFMHEMATTPQAKQNFISGGGKVEDVFSIVLQLKEGYLTFVHDKWFMMNDEGIKATLAENHIADDTQLKKLRLLEQVIQNAEFTDNRIIFKVAEELTISIDTENKKLYLNESEAEKGTTLETLFNSPVIPFMAKAFYPIINEAINNVDLFMNLDSVKRVHNIMNTAYECFVFNYKNSMYQYRIDKYSGNSYWNYDNAMSLIENVMHELGADLTFFYENQLSEELKIRVELEKQEKALLEKLTDIEKAIGQIREEGETILKENKALSNLYNSLLVKKHKVSEELKSVRNSKNKVIS
jgi:hypothetical protein